MFSRSSSVSTTSYFIRAKRCRIPSGLAGRTRGVASGDRPWDPADEFAEGAERRAEARTQPSIAVKLAFETSCSRPPQHCSATRWRRAEKFIAAGRCGSGDRPPEGRRVESQTGSGNFPLPARQLAATSAHGGSVTRRARRRKSIGVGVAFYKWLERCLQM